MKKALRKKAVPPARPPRKRKAPVPAAEFKRMKEELAEALETLNAIRSGEVDAVVVHGAQGHQIYSLAGAEHPYRVYVEQMQEGAVTVASDGLILYCNQRFADMVCLPLERAMGSSILQHISEEAWRAISAVFAGAGEAVKHQARLRCQNLYLPVGLTGSPLPLEGQSVMCLVVTDLSDQVRKGELERAGMAKDAFLAALSHELRTPLNPVLLVASEAAEDASLPEHVRADFAMIRKNVELEARLIDDLLDLTHVSSGKMRLQKTFVSLHDILHDAMATVQTEIDRKQIELTVNFAAPLQGVSGDSVRLQQIFWNVLKNAVKFTPEKGRIFFETRSNAEDKMVTVRIRDTGIGMTEAELGRVFSAFSQGDHADGGAHRFGGVGLGLAISKMLVELHGGRIHALSEGRDQGATFIIELPLAEVVKRHKPFKVKVLEKENGVSNGKPERRRRILLVEDHDATRFALAYLLARRHCEVEAAATIAEALARAEKSRFDLVISDIGLPDGSGNALMEVLRDRYQLPGVALTGYGMEQDVQRTKEAGFAFHLTKPVHAHRLDEALQATLLSVS